MNINHEPVATRLMIDIKHQPDRVLVDVQSGSGNIWRAPLTLPIITGYRGELTHITLQCPL